MPIPQPMPQHQPRQLALPFRLPPAQLDVDGESWRISPSRLWATLTPEEQQHCRQQLVAVLVEVVHDRASL